MSRAALQSCNNDIKAGEPWHKIIRLQACETYFSGRLLLLDLNTLICGKDQKHIAQIIDILR